VPIISNNMSVFRIRLDDEEKLNNPHYCMSPNSAKFFKRVKIHEMVPIDKEIETDKQLIKTLLDQNRELVDAATVDESRIKMLEEILEEKEAAIKYLKEKNILLVEGVESMRKNINMQISEIVAKGSK